MPEPPLAEAASLSFQYGEFVNKANIPCQRSIPFFDRVYQFRLGNNVRVTSQLVFTSREIVNKEQPPLATFIVFPLSTAQRAGDNGIESLLINLGRVSCTNYFMSIYILRYTSRAYEFMEVNPPSFPSIRQHVDAPLDTDLYIT